MEHDLAHQLKAARIDKGYSQNDIANILNITRQSVSKWERGLVYPDLDNLIRLSDIYSIPVDNLIRGNHKKQVVEQKDTANVKVSHENLKVDKVNVLKYQNVMKGLLLMVLSIISTLIAPIGVLIPSYVIWRNSKHNILYKSIIAVSIIAIVVSLVNCFVIYNDNFSWNNKTTVYPIK
ncbi:helix-turn-helix domain-containing protein [Lactiplantibacillus plantarum]|uniref:helix-turn-helix domain-containing protein n=1 Tax=Lactiplantibacillus plantarum TaxID=1590 RepID=UPI0021A990E6|nr:helix-turn-helix transcriptional regulator [Lactiplantibacillus plantarum]MCT4451808.1 XRE family transcriptional regulator [Lactiplantibacillus plantarum]